MVWFALAVLSLISILFCNPSTKWFNRISNWESCDAECLLNGEATFGFTFNPYSDDYKLINLLCYFDEDNELRE